MKIVKEKTNMNSDQTDTGMSHDDADMLQQVLMNVRGSYPDSPYRQVDYNELIEDEFEPTV